MHLLSIDQLERVKSYVYRGADTSPTYKYFLSPWAEFCVENFIPVWMAPNLITLTGLFATVTATSFVLVYDPLLIGNGPRWLPLLTSICIFAYQTLDNMDGKQARRTGTSSPLGLLFDHGCDSINSTLCAIPMSAALATGWNVKLFFALWCGTVPFYFQTWEEYYTENMELPAFNGPSDGLCIAVIMCWISFIFGPQIWQQVCFKHTYHLLRFIMFQSMKTIQFSLQAIVDTIGLHVNNNSYMKPYVDNITPFTVMTLIVIIVGIITARMSVMKALVVIKNRNIPITTPIIELLPFLVFFSCSFFYVLLSEIAITNHPVISILLIGSIFVEITMHIMLAHISTSLIYPWRRVSVIFIILLAIFAALKGVSSPQELKLSYYFQCIEESYLLYMFTIFSVILTGTKIYMVRKSSYFLPLNYLLSKL